jgi:hypothetical protein
MSAIKAIGYDWVGTNIALFFAHGVSPAEAESALSFWRHGHFPYLGCKTRAMDDSFHDYVSTVEPLGLPSGVRISH